MPLRFVALKSFANILLSFALTIKQVAEAFKSQPRIADFLYCSAGGNHAENGFFLDLQPAQLDSCMKNNYYSTAYAAKAMLDIWVKNDKTPIAINETPKKYGPNIRKIVFINSAAAFLGLPGSVAYTRKLTIPWKSNSVIIT